MAQLVGAVVAMVLVGTLIGWLLRKVSALSVFSSRLAGVAVLLFAAPALYSFNSGRPFGEAFIVYGIGAVIAAGIFYILQRRESRA
ncbi:hypothetical protein [Ensifer sp.]|uniref:hypothetical protein n=1 Tax=Ensifer sp. TaxID=1872086 RepID=UPI002E0F8FE2|nr:hypothetical protein [Ensifer sp.]